MGGSWVPNGSANRGRRRAGRGTVSQTYSPCSVHFDDFSLTPYYLLVQLKDPCLAQPYHQLHTFFLAEVKPIRFIAAGVVLGLEVTVIQLNKACMDTILCQICIITPVHGGRQQGSTMFSVSGWL